MSSTLGQAPFLSIDPPIGGSDLTLLGLEGEDILSRCFSYTLDVATTRADNVLSGLLGRPLTLWIANHDATRRRALHAHVRRVTGTGRATRSGRHFRLELAPRLWFLSCTVDCRVFQNLSIPAILQTLFQDEGLSDFEFRVDMGSYPPLDYCVQYRETSLDFACRLMEQVGLFFWHEHKSGSHRLIVADSNASARNTDPAKLTVSVNEAGGELRSLDIDCSFRSGVWALNDYDFTAPGKNLLVNTRTVADAPRMLDHEIYEYPGKFQNMDDGRRLTRVRVEMEEAQQSRVSGSGTCVGFDPGRRFGVKDKTYLLTEVRHRATSASPENGQDSATYANDYVAIPVTTQFRAPRTTPKPVISGTQTATIVGPAGQNIYCDEYGRVRLQFHWDRRGKRNDTSSCWVRVAQARSGSYYGTLAIPHVGHEVLVAFIEGDPDRPIIVGTLPNALTMPPVVLPGDKNKTIQRDHGDNKIVMQGTAGKEYLSLISPRAVNMLASGRSARPLSSGTPLPPAIPPPAAPSGSTLTFYSDPVSYALDSTTPPVQGAGAGESISVSTFQDPQGLEELWEEWYGTTQSDVEQGSAYVANESGSYGTQDGSVADSYLNWGSAGKINCLTFGNNNNWVYADANTWVNKDVNTQINGNSYTTIGGYNYGSGSSTSLSKTTIWGTSNTIVYGANVSTTTGDSTSTTLATSNSFVGGLNLSVTAGISASVVLGFSSTTNTVKAFVSDVTMSEHMVHMVDSVTRIVSNAISIDMSDLEIVL